MQRQGTVVLVLIFIQVLFGVNFPASKVIVEKMDPVIWSNLRFLFAGIGMLIMSLVFRRKHPHITKEFLKEFIWNDAKTSDATMRTVIKRVKDKISDNDFIVSKKGLGYIVE